MNAPMPSLPVVIFQFALSPYEEWQKLAWTGALLITVTVLAPQHPRPLPAPRENPDERRLRPRAVAAPVATPPASARGPRREGLDPQSRVLLRRQPRAQGHHPAALRQQGDGLHRPVGLRQVHAAARAEPHVRPLSRPARHRPGPVRRREPARCRVDINLLRARIGMVFQKPTPFPMSIYENIAFGIRLYEKLPRAEVDARVENALRRAALWDEVKDKLDAERARPVRRPAAAAVHRPHRGGEARGASCSTSPARRSIRSRPPRSRS